MMGCSLWLSLHFPIHAYLLHNLLTTESNVLTFLQVFSTRDISDQISKVNAVMSDPNQDWEKRIDNVRLFVFVFLFVLLFFWIAFFTSPSFSFISLSLSFLPFSLLPSLSLCVSLPPLPPSSLLFRFLTQFCCRVWLCCNCIKDKLPNRHSCLKPLCLCNKSSVSQSPLFFFLFFFLPCVALLTHSVSFEDSLFLLPPPPSSFVDGTSKQ